VITRRVVHCHRLLGRVLSRWHTENDWAKYQLLLWLYNDLQLAQSTHLLYPRDGYELRTLEHIDRFLFPARVGGVKYPRYTAAQPPNLELLYTPPPVQAQFDLRAALEEERRHAVAGAELYRNVVLREYGFDVTEV
jgi:hypothetical protein